MLQRACGAELLPDVTLRVPDAATDDELALAHDGDYVRRVRSGELDSKEVRRIGLPWSPELVERSLRSVGGTIAACSFGASRGDRRQPVGRHAPRLPRSGRGVLRLQRRSGGCPAHACRRPRPAASRIIDCDVHQGNGTAAILADDAAIFTFSIHGAKNFPFHKERSDLDVEMPDATDDAGYLEALQSALASVWEAHTPDFIIYLAGADPYQGDALGRLALSKQGLATRDELVLSRCATRGVPAAVVMAGGYPRPIEDTVDIHAATVRRAADLALQ